jgi:hypothetical protein
MVIEAATPARASLTAFSASSQSQVWPRTSQKPSAHQSWSALRDVRDRAARVAAIAEIAPHAREPERQRLIT